MMTSSPHLQERHEFIGVALRLRRKAVCIHAEIRQRQAARRRGQGCSTERPASSMPCRASLVAGLRCSDLDSRGPAMPTVL